MIFISGVHGAGKSYFCNLVKEATGIECYSASSLIKEKKKQGFPADKRVADIDENQLYLLAAVDDLRASPGEFLLDGHFCLLNKEGAITRIPLDTFTTLRPEAIILLTEDPEIIAQRRQERDGVEHKASDIKAFQDEEVKYAGEVAELLQVPLKISTGSKDIENTIEFIRNGRS
jgi:adenylate kinase